MAEEGVINLLGAGAIIVGVIVLILIIVVLGLSLTQRRLRKKLALRQAQMERFRAFYGEFEKLRNSTKPSNEVFKEFDTHVKKLLRQKYQLGDHIDYASLRSMFKKLNKPHLSQFCDQMLQTIYSGDSVTKPRLNTLIKNFETIIKEEKIRPFQHVDKIVMRSDIIKPKPLPQQLTIPNKKSLTKQEIPSQIEMHEQIPAQKMPEIKQAPKQLPSQPQTPKPKKKRRTFIQWLLGVNPDKPSPQAIRAAQASVSFTETKEVAKKPLVKPTPKPPTQHDPLKPKRSFWQWLTGKKPTPLQSKLNLPGEPLQNKPEQTPKKIMPKPVVKQTLPKPKKKRRSFIQWLLGVKEEDINTKLPDLKVPALPPITVKPRPSAPVKTAPSTPVTLPAEQKQGFHLFNTQKKQLTIPSKAPTNIKPLPNDGYEIYTVKEEVLGNETLPSTPKNRSTAQPEVSPLLEDPHIESIDSMDRIKGRIALIHKLRREAKLEK